MTKTQQESAIWIYCAFFPHFWQFPYVFLQPVLCDFFLDQADIWLIN